MKFEYSELIRLAIDLLNLLLEIGRLVWKILDLIDTNDDSRT